MSVAGKGTADMVPVPDVVLVAVARVSAQEAKGLPALQFLLAPSVRVSLGPALQSSLDSSLLLHQCWPHDDLLR